ncbi:hypothetical protein AB0K21_03880 [Streptosporangium sp. NPDC049248]|uniref:hypothetical protein n=1 Tax=Streptosporangium sp. NPDC049248 TaxID=3155651 RepID=UPI00343AE08E
MKPGHGGQGRQGTLWWPSPARPRDRYPVELAPPATDVRHHLRQVSGGNGADHEVDVTLSPG